MEEPEAIVEVVEKFFAQKEDLKGKNILITAGPTYEKIDPVRFIGNYSSGKMGYSIAEECARRGADVALVSGPVGLKTYNPKIKVIKIESAREMLSACIDVFESADCAIMSAAVADYYVANVADKKVKREDSEIPNIELKKNPEDR